MGLDEVASSKWMAFPHKDVDAGVEERVESESLVTYCLLEHPPVEAVEVQDANLAAEASDILDDLSGGCLAHDELVIVGATFADDVDEGLHREGIVLGAHCQSHAAYAARRVTTLEHVCLFDDLPRIA